MKRILLLLLFIGLLCLYSLFPAELLAEENDIGNDFEVLNMTAGSSGQVEIDSNFESMKLSLVECFALALKNNFDIKIAGINPEISADGLIAEKSRFDPVFKFGGELREDMRPINSQLVGGLSSSRSVRGVIRSTIKNNIEDDIVERIKENRGIPPEKSTPVLDTIVDGAVNEIINRIRPSQIPSPSGFPQFFNDRRAFTASIDKLLPTGAIFGLEYNFVRSFIDPDPFNAINTSSTSYLEAHFIQPLLKNFGIFKTRSPIYIARNNEKISMLQFKKVAIDVLNLTQTAYWSLIKSIDDLRVSKVSLKRANDLLEKNKIQVDIGTLAPIELVQAEDGVAKQEEAVIIAKHNVNDKEDELKQILNLDENLLLSNITIIPQDVAVYKPIKTDLDDAIKIAIESRPDYIEKKLVIDNANIKVKQKKNEVLPQLDFVAGVRYSGLGSDFDDSNEGLFSEQFQGEYFGINFEVPIGMRAARSSYRSAKLQAKQAVLDIKKKEHEIIVEVRKAVRKINTNMQRIKATKKARELAQKRLDAEEKKYEVGRSTSLEVLRAQENLAIAEGNEIKAIVDYNISIKNLEAVQGTILRDNDIIVAN